MYGQGISHEGEILDLGTELDIVQKSGTWFSYGDTRLGQGRENVKNFFLEHPDVEKEIEEKIRTSDKKDTLLKKTAKPRKQAKQAGRQDADAEKPAAGGNNAADADIDIEVDDE